MNAVNKLIFLFITNSFIVNAQHLVMDSIGASYSNKQPLYKSEWIKKGFNTIGKFNDHPKYYIQKMNVFKGEESLVLIQSLYDHENSHWLVIVDNEGNLLDYIETAYDNDEGFLQIQSSFYEEDVVVDIYNGYESPDEITKAYLISANRFLLKKDIVFEYSESYGSTCCPKDPAWDTKESLEAYIKRFEKDHSVVLKESYKVIQGKEGEKTYYLSFKGWNKKVKERFIRERIQHNMFLNWSTMKTDTYNDMIKKNRRNLIFELR